MQAVLESRTCGVERTKPPTTATLHVWFEDAISWSGVNAFVSGMTLLTVPTFRSHDMLVRGWVEEHGARLIESEAKATVVVAWWWPGLFVPPMWSGPDGEEHLSATLKALTRAVIDDLALRFNKLPPRPAARPAEVDGSTVEAAPSGVGD